MNTVSGCGIEIVFTVHPPPEFIGYKDSHKLIAPVTSIFYRFSVKILGVENAWYAWEGFNVNIQTHLVNIKKVSF